MMLISISLGDRGQIWVFGVVILGFYIFLLARARPDIFASGLKTLFFMRWFFLSLVLVYGWLGSHSTKMLHWWEPDPTGLVSSCYQIAIISLFVLIVNLLIRLTKQDELIEGLYCLMYPIRVLGLDPQRFVLRIMLVLKFLDETLLSLKLLRKNVVPGRWLDQVIEAGAQGYRETLVQVDSQTPYKFVTEITLPQWWQWLLPIFLGLFLIFM